MEFKLPERPQNSHKGTFGKVLNIAGNKYMLGAAYLSSVSSLKIGCGYCILASCNEVIKSVSTQTKGIVFANEKDIKNYLKQADVVTIGCGLGKDLRARRIFKSVFSYKHSIPFIIDADGLNLLSKINIKLPDNVVLTPHPKEAARILNTDISEILSSLKESAEKITKKYNCVTVLKHHNTIVCSKECEIYENTTGNSALAKAGSGDVLTGMIAGLIAQHMNLYEAAKLAVYLHGKCGELAANDLTEYCVLPEDLIEYIPLAIKSI